MSLDVQTIIQQLIEAGTSPELVAKTAAAFVAQAETKRASGSSSAERMRRMRAKQKETEHERHTDCVTDCGQSAADNGDGPIPSKEPSKVIGMDKRSTRGHRVLSGGNHAVEHEAQAIGGRKQDRRCLGELVGQIDLETAMQTTLSDGCDVTSSRDVTPSQPISKEKPPKPPKRKTPTQKKKTPLGGPKRKGRPQPAPLPGDWSPDLAVAEKLGLSRTEARHQAKRFETYYRGEGREKADWDAVWENWLLRDHKPAALPASADDPDAVDTVKISRLDDRWPELSKRWRQANGRKHGPFVAQGFSWFDKAMVEQLDKELVEPPDKVA